ncbi:MAG TPA: alpha/beta fold hydrolase [Solirubrobacteraceae bacterium]|jgi:dienelactone hydrolase|nr:alpha/beta fold hydrolase [Solirubrobacteraceae bacterium]
MTRLGLDDELLDAQLLRAVGTSLYDGADLGECLQAAQAAQAVRGVDLDAWHDAWVALAERVAALARAEQQAGHLVSARSAYLRASTYFRTAGVMLFAVPVDPRQVTCNLRQTEMFRLAAALMRAAPEVLEIPFEDASLPGYFIRPDGDPRPRATVVLTGGYDGTCEELYFYSGAAALARGYNVLAFDGPGQGAALFQQGMPMRPNWESVITPVIDYAVSRADVDPGRLALIGLSLGAHLAPRAASREHRLAALIADCGSYDLQAALLARLPAPLAARYAAGDRGARLVLRAILKVVAGKPTAGWALRRGQLVHGLTSPIAYVDALSDYSLAGHAQQITCPTWVCNAEHDEIGASAPELVAALDVESVFVEFTAAEGAGDHCEQGARTLYHARSFAWLDDLLQPHR